MTIIRGLIIASKVLPDQNKRLQRFQFHFVHWVFKLCISYEFMDLRTVKDTSFQLFYGESWEFLTQVSEAATTLVQSFGELFDKTELDV